MVKAIRDVAGWFDLVTGKSAPLFPCLMAVAYSWKDIGYCAGFVKVAKPS
jgi:hypothetical protein